MGINEDLADERAARLVRDAMDHTTAELLPPLDLVGPARAQGLRRRARVRAAIGGGVLAVAALGLSAAFVLPGGGQEATRSTGVTGVAPSPTDTTGPVPPVHLEPSPGESSMADLPPAERARQENFQNQAVGVLQRLLPTSVGTVQRTDLSVQMYHATKDGKTFVVIFSVRPSEPGPATQLPCAEARGMTCKKATLPGGVVANAVTMPMDSATTTGTELTFRYGKSTVRLSVNPHTASNTSAPVTNDQLLELAQSPAFLDLVKTADANPMEKAQRTVRGG
ncbi:hypothetical protein ACIQK5_26070 [Streptomyces virginiae]|uniref:hypothetical protein n=1 Tax=Streptomyces TaxID=1883 RepID=UPI00136FCF79|nr:hypothetical protein [Streptomyces sp. SID1046]MYV77399.1 hypothetical protein [Streptomyces sp. SID1046]